MNKFIVWDKTAKEFADNICLDAELLQDGISYSLEVKEELFELFYPIGLTDINGKSIYADSSIVEFDYLVDIENEIFQKRIGVFYFEKTFLAYHISFLSGINRIGGNADNYNAFGIKNFKIIDTIQENKLGLIKNDS